MATVTSKSMGVGISPGLLRSSRVLAAAVGLGLLSTVQAAGAAASPPVAAASEEAPPAGPKPVLLPAAPLLDAKMLDLDDQPVTLRSLRGQVVVLLHQDKSSSAQNAAFKDRLGQLALRLKDRVKLVALAEVGAYNFWPARRYVKAALQPLRAEGGTLVLCDWHSAVRKSYGLTSGQSAIFVLSPAGELSSLKRGVLSEAEQAALLGLVESLARPQP